MSSVGAGAASPDTIGTWFDFVPEDWRSNDGISEVLLLGFTTGVSARAPSAELVKAVQNVPTLLAGHPVRTVLIRLNEDNVIPTASAVMIYSDEDCELHSTFQRKTILAGNYCLFLSPTLRLPDGGTNEGAARDAIYRARGLYGALIGHTAADQLQFELRFDPTNPNKTSYSTGGVERFASASAFAFCGPTALLQLEERLSASFPVELQRRVAVALLYVGKAMAEPDPSVRLTNLWTALEVSAGTHEKASNILCQLAHTEGHIPLNLRVINAARNRLLHNGERYILSSEQERLLCAAVLAPLFGRYRINDPALRSYLEAVAQERLVGQHLDR